MPSGNPSNSACQSPGRNATLGAVVLGSSVPSIPVVDTVAVASQYCTALVSCSHADAATAWHMRVNAKRCAFAASGRHGKSECGWELARAWEKRFLINRKVCTGGPMTACAACMMLPQNAQPWASYGTRGALVEGAGPSLRSTCFSRSCFAALRISFCHWHATRDGFVPRPRVFAVHCS